jgi:hypothetical protein
MVFSKTYNRYSPEEMIKIFLASTIQEWTISPETTVTKKNYAFEQSKI